tara:strand:- start:4042 stop:4224 length:183 start_codon:yes stop_codon:yes gene_type:complete
MDELNNFDQLNLPQQIVVVKEIAKVFKDCQDPFLLDQLITFLQQLEVPEIINMNEMIGEA